MHDATRRVIQWIIGVKGEVPLVEELMINTPPVEVCHVCLVQRDARVPLASDSE
jgi:hypothetical protein